LKVPSLQGLFRTARQLAVVALALVLSALLHLKTELGLSVATDLLNVYVSKLIAGRLEAGHVEALGLERIVVRDVSLYDPNGMRVIYGEEIVLAIDPFAALDGTLRFSHARLRRGRLRLAEDATGELTFLRALEAADTSPSDPDEPPFHAVVDDMRLEEVRVFGELLGLSGIYAQHVSAHGRMEFEAATVIQVFSGGGEVTAPFDYVGRLDQIVARVSTDDRVGTDLYVRAHTGEDHARVNLHYGLPEGAPADGEIPLELDLRVAAEPISAATIAASGFDWASSLRGRVRGRLRLVGPPDRLRLEGDLLTDGGPVALEGELPSAGDVVVRAESGGLALAGLVDGAPEATIVGGATLRVPSAPGGAPPSFEAHAEPFEVAGFAVPALHAEGRLLDDGLILDALEGTEDGGSIRASGTVGYDGSYHLSTEGSLARAHAEPNLASAVPGLRGGVRFHARLDGGTDGLEAHGAVDFHRFAYDAVQAAELSATGHVVTAGGLPTLDLRVSGREVRVGGLPLGTGSASLTGANGRYRFHSSLEDGEGRASGVEGELAIRGDVVTAELPRVALSRGGVAYTGAVSGIRITPRETEVASVHLERGDQRVDARLTLRDHEGDEIDLIGSNLSIDELRRFFGPSVPDVGGRATLNLRVRGDLDDAPRLGFEGDFSDVTLLGVEHSSLLYSVHLRSGNATIGATLGLADRGTVRLEGTALVEGGVRDVERALLDAIYDLDFDVDDVSVAVLSGALGDPIPGVDGSLSGSLEVEGPVGAPTFRSALRIPDLEVPGWPTMSLTGAARYEYGSFSANTALADAHGTLVEGEGSVLMDVVYAVQHPEVAISTLDTSPWRFSIRVPPRPMAGVPVPILTALAVDLSDFQVAGSLTLAGGAFRTRGHLIASVDYVPAEGSALCGVTSEPRATLVAELADGHTEAELHAVVGGKRVATVTAAAVTPLDAWLHAADLPERPVTSIEATIHQAPTEAVPLVCERLAGNLEGSVRVDDLFGAAPSVTGELYSDALRVRRLERSRRQHGTSAVVETPPIKIRADVTADPESMSLRSDMRWWNGGETTVTARLGSDWTPGALYPDIRMDGPASARATFSRMPLEAAVAWVPGLANIEGLVEGEVDASGTLLEPHLAGSVDVEAGQLDLRGLGQRLRNVQGHASIEDSTVHLVGFRATDGDGVVHIDGSLELEGLALARSTLQLGADGFPIRQEGSIMAALTGHAELTNEFEEGALTGAMRVDDLVVQLPDDSGRSPQDLTAHPDICVHRRATAEGLADASGDCGLDVVADEDAYRVDLTVDASRPFWVKSSEFEALVAARLEVLYRDPDFRVGGAVELRQGFFEVFGKRFDIDEGSMVFDASSPTLNPQVLLIATHRLRNDPNRTVTVHASGTLAHPVIEFSSTVPTNNEGEIIALLITGTTNQRRQSTDTSTLAAGQEAANFLAGVAFGVASLSLREEFGEHFPVISVETADGGFRSARIRAGFTADEIIPERMRSVVEGVYIEGYFTAGSGNQAGATGATTTGTGQNSGFLIELQFPHNIVGTGTFSPGSNWGVDLTWEP
jgi:translocation and assembly module TamB